MVDLSGLRAAVSALHPDPLAGLDPRAQRDALREWKQEFVALYQQDRAVGREEGRIVWTERIAAERLRAEPVARALREGWQHLSPDERAAGWAAIREARQRIMDELNAAPRPNFRDWLEHVAEHDPRARALRDDMLAGEARKERRKQILDEEEQRIAQARASEPRGERDPARAAEAAKDALHDRRAAAEAAEKAAVEAQTRVPWWGRLTGAGEAVRAAQEAQATAAEARARASGTLRGVADDARDRAKLTEAAWQGWFKRGGHAAICDAETLQAVRDAVADNDREMIRALDRGGYEAAKALQDERDWKSGGGNGGGMQAHPAHDQNPEPGHGLPALSGATMLTLCGSPPPGVMR